MEGTRLFIIQVKEEVERCLVAGMSKEQMFRELREKGLHLAIVFAVYKELRDQNDGFFDEYYGKIDLRKQAERLQRLLHQYRTARNAAAGARALRTATAPTTMAIPHNVGSSEHQTVPAGSAPSQRAGQLPAGEQLHPSEHWLPNAGVRGLPSAAGPSNAVMTGSWPPFARRPRVVPRRASWTSATMAVQSIIRLIWATAVVRRRAVTTIIGKGATGKPESPQPCWFFSLTYISTSFLQVTSPLCTV